MKIEVSADWVGTASWERTISRMEVGPLRAEVEPAFKPEDGWEWTVSIDAYSGGYFRSGEAATVAEAKAAAEDAIRDCFATAGRGVR